MASTAFSLEVAKRRLDENGFFDLEDPAMGEYVWQMEHRGFPFVSEYGLDFCKERVLDDEVSTVRPSHGSCLTLFSVLGPSLKLSLEGAPSRTG